MVNEIILNKDNLDSINNLIDEIIQDSYSLTATVPTGTKIMMKEAILNYLKQNNK